uniref:Uncharacterized protein n=1 Tax=Setaria viridis TaxID=4556 RepID=A0A4U6VSJ8_SETVI|nr:hypothetical protein SEVIR_2G062250v2 [Setaria viridis]
MPPCPAGSVVGGRPASAPVGTGKFWDFGAAAPVSRQKPPPSPASPRAPRLAAAATAETETPQTGGVTGARYKSHAPRRSPASVSPFPPACRLAPHPAAAAARATPAPRLASPRLASAPPARAPLRRSSGSVRGIAVLPQQSSAAPVSRH